MKSYIPRLNKHVLKALSRSRRLRAYIFWRDYEVYRYRGRGFFPLAKIPRHFERLTEISQQLKKMGSSHNQISVSAGWWLFPWARTDSVNLIVSKSYGQLGNQIIENACSVDVAKRFGVNQVIPENPYPFREGLHYVAGVTFQPSGGTIQKVTNSNIFISFLRGMKPEVHLRGAFFLSWYESTGRNHPQPSRTIFRDLAKAMDMNLEGHALPEDQIVAHIRGGDIFERPINPHYGQPPLSFYQFVLASKKMAQSLGGFTRSGQPGFRGSLDMA